MNNCPNVINKVSHLCIMCREFGITVASTAIASYASPSIDNHVSCGVG